VEILHGFTLIDGTGAPPLANAAIAFRGARIIATGRADELRVRFADSTGVIETDLGGAYVVPGLIDAHVHLATVPDRPRAEAELRRMLRAGITSVRDMAGDARALASLARDTRLGEIEGPDVYYSALMAGPSFLADPRPQASARGAEAGEVPWMQAITPETDMVTAVAMARGTWAQGIKIYANLEWNEVTRITEEAHRQGMRVWAHSMVFPTRPLQVVRSGVDVVSHVCRLAWEAVSDAPTEYHHERLPDYGSFTVDAPVFTELFAEMKARGTILDATLALYARADRARAADPDKGPPVRCDTDFARRLVRRAHEEGVAIAAGTDFSPPADEPFPALNEEIEELVAHGGLSPMDAIVSATRIGAEAIGIAERVGTLEAGKLLDLVVLEADPTRDIRNLRRVREVWKNAGRVERSR
jgi:imidazolonepropionase-like amidohydrolase